MDLLSAGIQAPMTLGNVCAHIPCDVVTRCAASAPLVPAGALRKGGPSKKTGNQMAGLQDRLRRMPPAVFPTIMGLFGVGLAWRTLAERGGLPGVGPLAEILLGAVVLLWLVAALAWLTKPLRRPRVLWEELGILPGRAGMAAFALTFMLAGSAILPHAPGLGGTLVWAGIAVLALIAVLISLVLLTGPREQRHVTPVFHLTYVGFIVAAVGLVPMGQAGLATEILYATIAAAFVIWVFSLFQMTSAMPPAPLRPLLAIHASPAALFAIVSARLGLMDLAAPFAAMALLLVLVLAASARWLLAAGFSALWGALTFPLAACATAVILALGEVGLWIGAALALAATILTAHVAQRVLKMWVRGDLAVKTNAATA